MSKMTFIDKLNILLQVSNNSKMFIILFGLLIALAVLLIGTNKKNMKRNRSIYGMTTIFISALVIIAYHSSLGKMFDYMMNNFFIVVYFPNIAIYLAAIIATNIILWFSVFSYKTSSLIKNTNIVIYTLMNYLLALILYTINTNKLDVFSQSSIYGNKNATALIELSSILFIVWILFLIVYKMILVYLKKEYKPEVKKVVINNQQVNPRGYELKNMPHRMNVKRVRTEQLRENSNVLTKEFDNMLTLEDYKLLVTILKEQKEKERIAAEKLKAAKEENAKYEELLSLYNVG